ncbi:MAG TPA: hypothetical protein VGX00_04095 [Thermoplasmata archaeon]|nr:hypothetical protein [Thermoplasmata archaeon]
MPSSDPPGPIRSHLSGATGGDRSPSTRPPSGGFPILVGTLARLSATAWVVDRPRSDRRVHRWFQWARPKARASIPSDHEEGSGPGGLHCPSCSRIFPGFSDWDEHIRLAHPR